MAQRRESVVTPERFAQGLTYEQWMGSIDRNQERFRENYDATELSCDPPSVRPIMITQARRW